MNISPTLRRRFGFFLFFCALAIALLALLRWQTHDVATKSAKEQNDRDTLLGQALALQKSYQRMVALGYDPHSIVYTVPPPESEGGAKAAQSPATTPDPNILGKHRVGRQYSPPASLLADNTAVWQLGGGQIIGDTTAKADVVFFLAGLTLEACQEINAILWQEKTDVLPSPSNTSVADWSQRRVVINTLYPAPGRGEGCLQLSDEQYLYYRVVFNVLRG